MADVSIANGTYTFDFRGVEASDTDCLKWLKSYASVLRNRGYATVLYGIPTPEKDDGAVWDLDSERVVTFSFDAEGRYSFESNLEWAETDKDENDTLAKMPGLCISVSYDDCIDSSCALVNSEVKISVGHDGKVSIENVYLNERWFNSSRDYEKECGNDDCHDDEYYTKGYQPDEFFSGHTDFPFNIAVFDSQYDSPNHSV